MRVCVQLCGCVHEYEVCTHDGMCMCGCVHMWVYVHCHVHWLVHPLQEYSENSMIEGTPPNTATSFNRTPYPTSVQLLPYTGIDWEFPIK